MTQSENRKPLLMTKPVFHTENFIYVKAKLVIVPIGLHTFQFSAEQLKVMLIPFRAKPVNNLSEGLHILKECLFYFISESSNHEFIYLGNKSRLA